MQESPSPFTVRVSRWRSGLLVLSSAAFIATGAFLLTTDDTSSNIVGIFALLVFGPAGVLGLVQTLRRSASLTVDARGITDRTSITSVGFVPWTNIRWIDATDNAAGRYVTVTLLNAPRISAVTIPTQTLPVSPHALATRMIEYRKSLGSIPVEGLLPDAGDRHPDYVPKRSSGELTQGPNIGDANAVRTGPRLSTLYAKHYLWSFGVVLAIGFPIFVVAVGIAVWSSILS